MVYARFTQALTNVTTNKVTQWDYGRILRIEGLKLPTAVRIDFGISGQQKSKSRIGITKDGVTDVAIPDSLLEQSKNLVAYVYVNDTTKGKTVKTINIPLEARAEPEEHDSPESKALFAEAIEMINDVAVRAENAEIIAKAHVDNARESLESTQQISSNFNETAANAVKAVIDAGTSQIQAVNNTRAEALEAIQAEGTAQLEHIQAAGETIVNAAAIAEQNAKNVLANAIKGNLSGEIVTADDVSPIEHEIKARLYGKNQFNMSLFEATTDSGHAHISAVSDSSITVTTPDGYEGSGNCGLLLTLKELCTSLKAGRMYVLSGESPSSNNCIYLRDTNVYWNFGTAKTLSEDDINSKIAVYGFSARHGDGVGDCIISNIQVEEGSTPTEYTPYIDPATVNVRRCGKNLIDVKNIELSNYTGYYYEIITDFEPKIGEMYVLSVDVECDTLPSSVSIGCGSNGFQGELVPYVAKEFSENGKIVVPFVWNLATHNQESGETKLAIRTPRYLESKTFNAKAYNFQLEIGDTATAYEPYKSTEHMPESDGTVSGMMSTAPNMTILTDTEGVAIECEYIKDTNKVIRKLADALGVQI